MFFRLVSIAVVLLIIGFMMKMVLSGEQAANNNPAVQEQKKILRDMGMNPDDKDALKKQMMEQVGDIQRQQNQYEVNE